MSKKIIGINPDYIVCEGGAQLCSFSYFKKFFSKEKLVVNADLLTNNYIWKDTVTKKKKNHYVDIRYAISISNFYFGGEGGIRTHGRLQTYANFQDWCHKPTRPPLRLNKYYISIKSDYLSR